MRTLVLLATLWSSHAASAVESAWFVLLEDEGCTRCRAEVFVGEQLAAIQWSGEADRIVPIDRWLRPDERGFTEVMVYVRGPEGPGQGSMTFRLGRAEVRDGVVLFAPDARRYVLAAEPAPKPFRLRVPASP